jgi:hypothetical protein
MLKESVAFIFKGSNFTQNGTATLEDEDNTLFPNVRNHSPSDACQKS